MCVINKHFSFPKVKTDMNQPFLDKFLKYLLQSYLDNKKIRLFNLIKLSYLIRI